MRRAAAVTVSKVPTSIHFLAAFVIFSCHGMATGLPLPPGAVKKSGKVPYGVRRESRVFDCLKGGNCNQTCCAVSSSLSAHASPAMAGCEAAETTYPGLGR